MIPALYYKFPFILDGILRRPTAQEIRFARPAI